MIRLELGNGNFLKILEAKDALVIFDAVNRNREHLDQWLPWVEKTREIADTEKFVEMTREQYSNNKGFQSGIWSSERLAGVIGFHAINWDHGHVSIGYWLSKDFEGKGIMTSAVKALIDYAFDIYGLNKVEIRCASGNLKSRAIPERLGFKLEGTLRQVEKLSSGLVADHAIYGMLASEWKQRN